MVPRVALLLFPISMLAAVLVDLDHPLAVALGFADSRFLHLPALFLLGIIVACSGGFWILSNHRNRRVLNE